MELRPFRTFSFLVCAALVAAVSLVSPNAYAGKAQPYLEKGWAALVKDNDAEAFRAFGEAYGIAKKEGNDADRAEALLNMGIVSYSISYTRGLNYAFRSMSVFDRIAGKQPKIAANGRSRCLQLISTIYSRQGKYRKAIAMSREALQGLSADDKSGTRGLMYNSLGSAYTKLGLADSAEYYHRLGLADHLREKNTTYLPSSLLYVAEIELENGSTELSRKYLDRSFDIADSTQNRQAMVAALLGLGDWYLKAQGNEAEAEKQYNRAREIAGGLSDRLFRLKVLQKWYDLRMRQQNFREALTLQQQMNTVRDSMFSAEKEAIQQQLEVQFDVSEKERKLRLIQKEKDISALTNYLLWGALFAVLVIFSGVVSFQRRINRRSRQLLETQRELSRIREEQQHYREQQLGRELTYKESQLSSMTLQMVQKSEWILDLKEKLNEEASSTAIERMLDRELTRDQEWTDFNAHFESINATFYNRIKQEYPDISPNDLKLCALIKLNLSIKEMSAILNISPNSVKTARYRLRKKLRLNTEDNLTEFILSLS